MNTEHSPFKWKGKKQAKTDIVVGSILYNILIGYIYVQLNIYRKIPRLTTAILESISPFSAICI